MNKNIVIALGVLVAAGAGVYYYLNGSAGKGGADQPATQKVAKKAPVVKKPYIPPTVGKMTPESWLEPAKVQEELGPKIVEAIGSASPEQLTQCLQQPETRLMVAQWMLAQHLLDSKKVEQEKTKGLQEAVERATKRRDAANAKLADGVKPNARQQYEKSDSELCYQEAKVEADTPHSVPELLESKTGNLILKGVANNPDWLEQVVFSGEDTFPAKTLGILSTILKEYPEFAKTDISRDTATATALEYGRYNWNSDRAVKRYNFFSSHQKKGDLNAVYNTLPFWQRRVVCGAKGDNEFCSLESFEWSLANVKLPQDQYCGCCWRCAYRLRNPYGESVHGSLYFAPFMEVYGRNRMRFTYEIGGVCGGLSHFGAYSACANGIPALTAGEPGHCAYIVLVGEKWTPAYSLSWERGLHWQVFSSVHLYSSLHMATDMFRQKTATAASNACRVLGGELARQGKVAEAAAAYGNAVTRQPNNYFAWRDYANFLKAKAANDKDAWGKYNELICKHLVPTYPEMAASLLATYAYDPMKKAYAGDTKALTEEMQRFWGSVKEMGPDRWRIEQHIGKQMQVLGIKDNNADAVTKFAKTIVKTMGGAPKYLPVAFSWVNSVSNKFAKAEDKQRLLRTCISSLSGMSGCSDADRVKVLAPLVLAAEKMRDMSTFQAIRKMLPEGYGKQNVSMPKFEPFPGTLTSQGGLVWISSTCQHDAPCEHPGILEPTGGRWHSANEADAWISVQLTKQTHVSGIVVVFFPGNMQRVHDIHVQISETGKDDDWHDVKVEAKPGRVMRVDLQSTNPLAKYVRVKRMGKDFFHLNAIYVYGKPAA